MAELPSGTLTFLLTDIEGSTALWERMPEGMRLAVARHDAVLSDAISQHAGVVVRSRNEGDSFFSVFRRATDAVMAACAIQRALHAEAWSTDTPIRVRIALYTGEAELREGDYYGAAVNRCGRLRAMAYGGQVLLSQTTYAFLGDDRPEGVSLLDLGEHHLRGVPQPVRVFQVVDPELPHAFPPLKTAESWPNNVPVQMTSLVGRESQAAELANMFLRDGVRLVALTGEGGIGKTRLAVEVSRRITEAGELGVVFVELASITTSALVPHAIAGALGLRERVDRPLLETLMDALRVARLLLVLDNCEHVLDGSAAAAHAILRACPDVRILVTSRSPLGISGEVTWSVPLLTLVPGAVQSDGRGYGEAVQLFVERARSRMRDFSLSASNTSAVVEICRRLDGLPLAIELAAARIQLLPPPAMLARLDRTLPFLVGGPHDAPTRHQTLRDTIAWSYDLLDDAERAVFRQLGIFAGGFSLEAVETVCWSGAVDERADAAPGTLAVSTSGTGRAAPDLLHILESLLVKNLLRRELGDEPRYTMLETIREYALELLEENGELRAIHERSAAFFLAFAEEESEKLLGRDQLESLTRLDTELDNLRVILGWCRDGEVTADAGLRLVGTLFQYWQLRGFTNEGWDWATALLALPGASAHPVARARAEYSAAVLCSMRGDFIAQRSLAQECARTLEEANQLREAGRSRTIQAIAETRLGNLPVARSLLEQSVTIARASGDMWGLALAFCQLGSIAYQEHDIAGARRFRGEAASVARANNDRHTLGLALAGLALVTRIQGDVGQSATLFHESLRVSSELNDQWTIPRGVGGLAGAAVLAQDYQRAAQLFGAMAAMRELSGIGEATGAFRELCTRDEADALAALGSEAFAVAWQEGRAMNPATAIAYALEERSQREPV